MKMFLTSMVLAALFSSTVLAQSEPGRPAKCCQPKQYECILGGQGGSFDQKAGKGYAVETLGFVSVDFVNQRMYVNQSVTTTPGKITTTTTTIQLYKKGIAYTIVDNKCYKTKIPTNFPQCIPDEATFLGGAYFGLKSAPLKFYAYRWAVDGIMTTIDFTQDKCLPFGANMQGLQGTNAFSMGMGYVNSQLGIKDPNVFTPPAICNDARLLNRYLDPNLVALFGVEETA